MTALYLALTMAASMVNHLEFDGLLVGTSDLMMEESLDHSMVLMRVSLLELMKVWSRAEKLVLMMDSLKVKCLD